MLHWTHWGCVGGGGCVPAPLEWTGNGVDDDSVFMIFFPSFSSYVFNFSLAYFLFFISILSFFLSSCFFLLNISFPSCFTFFSFSPSHDNLPISSFFFFIFLHSRISPLATMSLVAFHFSHGEGTGETFLGKVKRTLVYIYLWGGKAAKDFRENKLGVRNQQHEAMNHE